MCARRDAGHERPATWKRTTCAMGINLVQFVGGVIMARG